MSSPSADDFATYFRALYDGKAPYPWQEKLAAHLASGGDWPEVIDLPTGSGKTACIDIAVFAMACQVGRDVATRTAPRRVFFCVNRRVIVDEAYRRSAEIARRLSGAPTEGILRAVADSLRRASGEGDDPGRPPLDVLELRGGIYRDNRWARSANQPTVVCTTIDQLGSRLLFRGYGVSSGAAPVQAALVAYDSLVLLDEAHISEPFRQTLAQVRSYLGRDRWADETVGPRPMVAVPMTATPGGDPRRVIRLDASDREHPALKPRLAAAKPARLLATSDAAKAAVEETRRRPGPLAIGIIVNRIATARAIHARLVSQEAGACVELVIGSMRPVDRDEQAIRLAPAVGPGRPAVSSARTIVVATQCLEVGADYDFDVLITECASLDALRQRFGRLNRAGRPFGADALVLMNPREIKAEGDLTPDKPIDPIYGNARTLTWNWLRDRAGAPPAADGPAPRPGGGGPKKAADAADLGVVDFGVDAFDRLLAEYGDAGRIPATLLAPSASLDAPVMLPAYLDLWCQTAPRPEPDPDITLFLHGPNRSEPDVQICWRDDLDAETLAAQGVDVVALLPPTSAECMSVPISRARAWLAGRDGPADHGDLLEAAAPDPDAAAPSKDDRRNGPGRAAGILWRGAEASRPLLLPGDLRPGDTLVLPRSAGGWGELGHIPAAAPDGHTEIDVAEDAHLAATGRAALRLHPSLIPEGGPEAGAFRRLLDSLINVDEPPTPGRCLELVREEAKTLGPGRLKQRLESIAASGPAPLIGDYPDRSGIVLVARRRSPGGGNPVPSLDDGDDDASRSRRVRAVTLEDHTRHVVAEVGRSASALVAPDLRRILFEAARHHDLGKADERFQAMLRRSDRTLAWLAAGVAPLLLAKSDGLAATPSERRDARRRAGLPDGFRHEMLSVPLAGRSLDAESPEARDLILHLIAAHHGHARPFAPVVLDDEAPEVRVGVAALTSSERLALPAHRLDSGIAERFWTLTRRHGWWGLAYLESLLRLADQQASADEDAGRHGPDETPRTEIEVMP